MTGVAGVLHWFNTDRIAVMVGLTALGGVFYAAQAARSARAQAVSSDKAAVAAQEQAEIARQQAQLARDQVELGRQQIDLLLRQIEQAERLRQPTDRRDAKRWSQW